MQLSQSWSVVVPLSDTDVEASAAPDELRNGIVAALTADLGEGVVDSHVVSGDDVWVRVTAESWVAAGQSLHRRGFTYFCFLSAIDWMPSPYGRGEDDPSADDDGDDTPDEMRPGYTGGDTRFQLLARVVDPQRHVGVTLKADVPEAADGSLAMPTWVPVYAGANWHERETAEMFGISFIGHPDPRKMYLPGDFEGHPLRKDFPLLARMVKPWPGIVDVEPMPENDEAADGGAADDNATGETDGGATS